MSLLQFLLPVLVGIIWASEKMQEPIDFFYDCKDGISDLSSLSCDLSNLINADREEDTEGRLLSLNSADEIKTSEVENLPQKAEVDVKRKKKAAKGPRKVAQKEKVAKKTKEQIEEERKSKEKKFEEEALHQLSQMYMSAEYKEDKSTFSFSFKHYADAPKSLLSFLPKKSPIEAEFQEKIKNVDFVTFRNATGEEVVIVVHSGPNEDREKSQFDEFVVDFKAKTVEHNIIRAYYGQNDFQIDSEKWIWCKERGVSDLNPNFNRSKNRDYMTEQTTATKERFGDCENTVDVKQYFQIGGSGYGQFKQGKKYNLTK